MGPIGMTDAFEIPDELRQFLSLEEGEANLAIATVLVDPEQKGELISIAAIAEDEIAKLIVFALAHPDRRGLSEDLMANQMTFHQKIEAFKKVLPEFDSNPDNYGSHLQFLAALKKLRNTAAHSFGISTADVLKLKTDSEIVKITANFPGSAWDKVTALRDYLQPLIPAD